MPDYRRSPPLRFIECLMAHSLFSLDMKSSRSGVGRRSRSIACDVGFSDAAAPPAAAAAAAAAVAAAAAAATSVVDMSCGVLGCLGLESPPPLLPPPPPPPASSSSSSADQKEAPVTKPRKLSNWRKERALCSVSKGRMPGMVTCPAEIEKLGFQSVEGHDVGKNDLGHSHLSLPSAAAAASP